MDEYVIMAWSLASFLTGAGAGIWLTRKLSGVAERPGTAALRRHFGWARSDIRFDSPTAENVTVRKVTNWEGAPDLDPENRTLTFHLRAADGLERDLTYTAAKILRFYKCDTPRRREWHGDVVEYTRLLAIARHYGWIVPNGNGYEWSIVWGTRERRLRLLSLMMTS